MSQSTEIKMNVGLTRIEHVLCSRTMAEYFNLHLIEGENQREIGLTGDRFGYINSTLQSYLRERPNDIVVKAIREILVNEFKAWDELNEGVERDMREPFELLFIVRLTN